MAWRMASPALVGYVIRMSHSLEVGAMLLEQGQQVVSGAQQNLELSWIRPMRTPDGFVIARVYPASVAQHDISQQDPATIKLAKHTT